MPKLTKEELELLGIALAGLLHEANDMLEQIKAAPPALVSDERKANAVALYEKRRDDTARLQVKLIKYRNGEGDGRANLKRIRELTKGAKR
jgi:hypothetical protein